MDLEINRNNVEKKEKDKSGPLRGETHQRT